jgi:hypothetical protein
VTSDRHESESIWSLRADIASVRILAWIASVGRDAELTPEGHQYLCDRYQRLADCNRRRGRIRAAANAEARAREHCDEDGPPFAAAMAMPRPRRLTVTRAVGGRSGSDDAA